MTIRLDIAKRNAATAQQALDALRAFRPLVKLGTAHARGWEARTIAATEAALARVMASLHQSAAQSLREIARILERRGGWGDLPARHLYEAHKHTLAKYREWRRLSAIEEAMKKPRAGEITYAQIEDLRRRLAPGIAAVTGKPETVTIALHAPIPAQPIGDGT